jgi:hypothetical protein
MAQSGAGGAGATVVGAAVDDGGAGAAVVGSGVVGATGLVVTTADVGATLGGKLTTGPVFDVTCSEAHAATASAATPIPHQ